MKKLIRNIPTIEFTIDIDIYTSEFSAIFSNTSLDLTDTEYDRFIDSMIAQFKADGYIKYDDPEYTHDSNRGSISQYYTFTRIYRDVRLIVVVNVRISDHPDKAKFGKTPEEKRRNYVSRVATEIGQKYNMSPIPKVLDIVFDDKHFHSYMSAQFYINHEIKDVTAEADAYINEMGEGSLDE